MEWVLGWEKNVGKRDTMMLLYMDTRDVKDCH